MDMHFYMHFSPLMFDALETQNGNSLLPKCKLIAEVFVNLLTEYVLNNC